VNDKSTKETSESEIILAYKAEIYDWWDHANACAEAARKLGISYAEVHRVAMSNAGTMW
jgi:hypothetical protein